MTENPAVPTNEAASLLGAVDKAQSETNLYLRARIPELFLLVNAAALASVIGRDHPTANAATVALGLAGLLVAGTMYVRRRYNLGGAIGRSVWIVTGLLLAASVACNLIVHGNAEETALGVCMGAAFLVLGAIEHSYVLAVIGVVILPTAVIPAGGLDKAVSAALGLAAVVFVGLVGTRKQLFERKAR